MPEALQDKMFPKPTTDVATTAEPVDDSVVLDMGDTKAELLDTSETSSVQAKQLDPLDADDDAAMMEQRTTTPSTAASSNEPESEDSPPTTDSPPQVDGGKPMTPVEESVWPRYWQLFGSIDTKPAIPLLDAMLVSFAQVNFSPSRITGLSYLIALLVADTWLGFLAIVSCLSAVLTAVAFGFDPILWKTGMTGYNGVLVGCAFAVFLGLEPWTWRPILASVVGGGFSAFAWVSCDAMSSFPAWTFPFNLVTLAALAYVQPFSRAAATSPVAWSEFEAFDLVKGVLQGISQIFVVEDWVSGLIMVVGTAWYRPRLAGVLVLGSSIGFAVAVAVHADLAQARAGLWGFNPALTAAAVLTFFQDNLRVFSMIVWSSVGTALLAAGLGVQFASVFKIPACTLPFCVVAALLFGLPDNVKGCAKADDQAAKDHDFA